MSFGLSLFTCQVLSSRLSQASGQPTIFSQESLHELLLIGNITHFWGGVGEGVASKRNLC